MRYRIQWRYWSSLCEAWGLGELAAGSTVDLTEAQAEAINRDSPGALKPYKEPARRAEPSQDRQVKAPSATRAAKTTKTKTGKGK